VTRVAAAAICKFAVALDASAMVSAKMANPDARGGELNAKDTEECEKNARLRLPNRADSSVS